MAGWLDAGDSRVTGLGLEVRATMRFKYSVYDVASWIATSQLRE
jgi:hypothetical protein